MCSRSISPPPPPLQLLLLPFDLSALDKWLLANWPIIKRAAARDRINSNQGWLNHASGGQGPIIVDKIIVASKFILFVYRATTRLQNEEQEPCHEINMGQAMHTRTRASAYLRQFMTDFYAHHCSIGSTTVACNCFFFFSSPRHDSRSYLVRISDWQLENEFLRKASIVWWCFFFFPPPNTMMMMMMMIERC